MPYYVTILLVDAYKRKTRKTFQLTAATAAAAEIDAADVVTKFKAITGLGTTAYKVWSETADVTAAAAASNKDEGVTISGTNTNGKGVALKVAAPIKANYVNPDGSVDLTEIALTAFLDLFLAAGKLTISDGDVISAWDKGVLDK